MSPCARRTAFRRDGPRPQGPGSSPAARTAAAAVARPPGIPSQGHPGAPGKEVLATSLPQGEGARIIPASRPGRRPRQAGSLGGKARGRAVEPGRKESTRESGPGISSTPGPEATITPGEPVVISRRGGPGVSASGPTRSASYKDGRHEVLGLHRNEDMQSHAAAAG